VVFDPKDYRNRVLNKYMGRESRRLSDALRELKTDEKAVAPDAINLAEFYDMGPDLTDANIAQRISDVENAIKQAPKVKSRENLQPLEFHELVLARNPEIRKRKYWDTFAAATANRTGKQVQEFGKSVEEEVSPWDVVTIEHLRELATGSGIPATIPDAELAKAANDAGIAVVRPMPASQASPQVVKALLGAMSGTTRRSLISVIFLDAAEPASFSVLDGFTSPTPALRLSLQAVANSVSRADRMGDSNEVPALQTVLTHLRTAATSDAMLQDLVTAYFVELGRFFHSNYPLKDKRLDAFVKTGLDRKDAARILQSFGSTGSSQEQTWSGIQAFVADGALKEARRAYENLFAMLGGSTSPEQAKALQVLSGTEAKVDELRRKAQAAQTQGDLETTTKALNEALTLCSDDETLDAAARAMPPAAPARFAASLSEDARRVKLSWEPGFGSTEDVVYQVIRRTGAPPKNNNDGTPIGAGIKPPSFEDAKPPVAVRIFYGVSASRGGGSSPVSVAEVIALPPVTDVVVSSDPSSVSLRWTTPPEARTIEITQSAPDGSSTKLQPGAQSGTTSNGLRTGAKYTYLITAVYTGAAGETLKSSIVRVTGIPRGVPKAVVEIAISGQGAIGAKAEVAAEWMPVEGYLVEVWHYAQKPTWLGGTRLGMAEVRSQGTQLAGRGITSGARQGVQGVTDQGLRHYVAITRDGEFGLVGAVQQFGSAPPVQNIRAERFGDEVVLSWDWPGPEYAVRVRWNGGERTIAMNEYQSQGGCRVAVGASGGTFMVASAAGEGASLWVSPEATITVEGSARAINYDVAFITKIFGPPSSATLRFTFAESQAPVDVVVIVHYSKFMPFDSTQGSEIKRATVSAALPQIDVTLPRGPKGPVWVRAFTTTPGARLIDPPPTRMKVD
jgi:hypothetical protein